MKALIKFFKNWILFDMQNTGKIIKMGIFVTKSKNFCCKLNRIVNRKKPN